MWRRHPDIAAVGATQIVENAHELLRMRIRYPVAARLEVLEETALT
jgi:hypothetical protein